MELLVTLVALVIFVVLALRFGYDSRPRPQSKEEELACLGMEWQRPRTAVWKPAGRLVTARRFVRHSLARALLAFATWLSPEPLEVRPTSRF
jgi:hypothetical protein